MEQENIKTLEELCEQVGFTPSEITGSSRVRELVDARQFIAGYYRDCGFSFPQIGEMLNRNHTSICHLINHRAKK